MEKFNDCFRIAIKAIEYCAAVINDDANVTEYFFEAFRSTDEDAKMELNVLSALEEYFME